MQNIIIDKPYEFVPPYRGNWWPWFLQLFVPGRLLVNAQSGEGLGGQFGIAK